MNADNAVALIKELERCVDIIPYYNDNLVRTVSNELSRLIQENLDESALVNASTSEDSANVSGILRENQQLHTKTMRHVIIKRNLRCLLAYHYNRLSTIRTMRWEFGSILPTDIKSSLSLKETEWFTKYSRSLGSYMCTIGPTGVNLALHLKPPKALNIEVICLVDYGRFELENGTVILLKKDTRHCLPRNECEELIRKGILKHIL